MKRLALLLALCLFVQCLGVPAALGDEVELLPVEDVASAAEEASPAEDVTAPVEEEDASAVDATPVKVDAPAEDATPAEVEAPAEDATPVKVDAPAEDATPAEVEVPTEEASPAKAEAPAEDATPANDEAPADDVTTANDDAPAEDSTPAKVDTPAEDAAPAEDVAPVEDAAPAEAEVPAEGSAPAEEVVPTEGVAPADDAEPAEGEAEALSLLAKMGEGAVIYTSENLEKAAATLTEEAAVLILEEKDTVSKIQYVVLSEDQSPELAEGFARNEDLSVLTIAEAEEWQAGNHPVKKDVAGFSLEPISFKTEEVTSSEGEEDKKTEEKESDEVQEETEPEAVEVKGEGIAVDSAVIETDADNASIGTAVSSVVLPEGMTAEELEGVTADVLGAGEFDFLADVLGIEGGSTDFAVDAAGTLIQYNGTSTVVQIPLTVMRNGTAVPVTGIEDSAFAGNTTVTQIIIPVSVVWIDTGAFKGCTALQSINIPDNVTWISEEAFAGCTSLRSVSWSDSVNTIRDRAFYNCSSLQTLGSSSNVTNIGDYAFYGCSSLTTITWSNWLNRIGKYSYANCTGLTGLSFPASLSVVDDYAFTGCTGIQKVDFQGNTGLNTISTGAFKDCTALQSIYIPDSVTFLGNSAFENCTSAAVLSLPASLTIIQDFTFRNCTSLTSLSIPNGVTDIHREAFYGCSNVEYVYWIPASVSFIGNYAFYGLRDDCCFVVENAGVTIGIDALGTSGTVFGWRYSTTQAYADSHGDVTFYDIRVVNYVRRCYNIILNRPGEAGGVIYWSRTLATKQNLGADIVHNFIFSAEFAARGLSNADVVEILYNAMQDRASDAPGKAYWVSFLDIGCSYDYVISGFGGSPEFHQNCNSFGIKAGTIPLTQNRDKNPQVTAFTQRCYNLILNRTADVDGLNYWTGRLLRKEESGGSIVGQFVRSNEFRGRGLSDADQVEILYNTMMNRASDASGKAYHLSNLAQGMSIEYVVKEFVYSVEFRYICSNYGINAGPYTPSEYRDRNGKVTSFVNRLYQYAMNRGADASGLNFQTGRILRGAATPAVVARDMFTSLESQYRGYSNTDFVDRVYKAMLNRAPSAVELAAGVASLNGGTSRETFVDYIGGTTEFQTIVSSLGL